MKFVSCVVLFFALINTSFAAKNIEQENYFPQKMSAEQLLKTCASSFLTSAGRERKKYCSGFISGVEESARLLSGLAIEPKICLPKGKTSSQYRDVYIRYAMKKTTRLSKPAALVVIEALQNAFPCPVAD